MKVYIGTDIEGISGVVNFTQSGRDEKGPEYLRARHLLTAEVNAAVEGALAAGADDILVSDGHAGGYNFIVEDLHPEARYIIGAPRNSAYPRITPQTDAVLLIGYHAMAGTSPAIMDHTQSSRAWRNHYLNGRKMGEIGQAAVIAGHHGVPVVFVSGDRATCEEAQALLGEVETVAVKEALSRTCAAILAPRKARALVREGVTRALGRLADFKPFVMEPPIEVKVETQGTDLTEKYRKMGWRVLDERTVVKVVDSALDILR